MRLPWQADPLGQLPDINRYRWEGDHPMNGADPSGLDDEEEDGQGYSPSSLGYGGAGRPSKPNPSTRWQLVHFAEAEYEYYRWVDTWNEKLPEGAPYVVVTPQIPKSVAQGKTTNQYLRNDTDKFKQAAMKNGMTEKDVDILISVMKRVKPREVARLGSHNACRQWLEDVEKAYRQELYKKTGKMHPKGLPAFKLVFWLVPLGTTGNKFKDAWKEFPFTFSLSLVADLAVNVPTAGIPQHIFGTFVGRYDQDHTTYQLTFADGSVWYMDLGVIQQIYNGGTIQDIRNAAGFFTPASKIPSDWVQSNEPGD